MRAPRHWLTTLLTTTALLAALATTASARDWDISGDQRIRTVFRPLILSGGGSSISCTVTLEGFFHYRVVRKIESLIGLITRAIIDTPNCRSAGLSAGIRASALTETLPWHIRYVSFSGRLPAVTIRIRIIRAGLDLIIPGPITCKYSATSDYILGGPGGGAINEGTGASTIRFENGIEIPSSSGFPCPTFRGESAATPVTLLGTNNAIIIRLI